MSQHANLIEYAKCLREPEYFGQKYCTVFDKTHNNYVGGIVPFKIFPKQVELLKHYRRFKKSIVLKPRQAGISTTTAFHAAHMIMFAPEESPERILIIANKAETANEFLTKIKGFIDSAPEWLLDRDKDGNVIYEKKNEDQIILPNGSGSKAKATSKDALRGYAPTLLIIDEAAFIENGAELWTAASPSLSTGGGCILLSTPNGMDDLYYARYSKALIGENDFKIFQLNWYEDPRYNKDLTWKKVIKEGDDILEDVIISSKNSDGTWTIEEFQILVDKGYKPSSSWFVDMCKELDNDPRKIAQELLCSFLGSGDNVISEDDIRDQEENQVKLPVRVSGYDRNIWIWEEPIDGHQYGLGCDVSKGSSDDSSAIVIFDIDTGHQVFEWHGKVPADILGVMVNEWGLYYGEALTVIDITGGWGQSTVLKLLELKYPNIHYSSAKENKIIKQRFIKYLKNDDLTPGFIIGANNRTLIVQAFELAIREKQIAIRSKRFTNELKTFIYNKQGRADHMRGYHDDIIFSAAILLFVIQFSFKNLKRFKEQTIAMLNAWNVESTDRVSMHQGEVGPDIAKEFGWLMNNLNNQQ